MTEVPKLWKLYMVIKKVFKLIGSVKKKLPGNKTPVINSVRAGSTLIGRKKVESLKKIGKRKREGNINISRLKKH